MSESLGLGSPLMKICDDLTTKLSDKIQSLYRKSAPVTGRQWLLITIDRQEDTFTPLYHSWSYLSLIQDIFDIKNNAFVFMEDTKAPSQNFEICLKSDNILRANAFKGFHEAGENVDKALSEWKQEYELLNRQQSNLKDLSKSLTSAMDSIPQMTE